MVSLHCNLDENTRHLINKARLEIMKPNAVLVNAARGPCIDEAALVAHMQKNPEFRCGARVWGMLGCDALVCVDAPFACECAHV